MAFLNIRASEEVEMVPPDTNRDPSFAGQGIRLGGRRTVARSCRDEVVTALAVPSERWRKQFFTVGEVHADMLARGTAYAESTVFKTMQRMKEPAARPPYARLERVGREGPPDRGRNLRSIPGLQSPREPDNGGTGSASNLTGEAWSC